MKLLWILPALLLSTSPLPAQEEAEISFIRDVAPILSRRCQGCHSAKESNSNYRLDTFEGLLTSGDFGTPPVTPGKLDNSELYRLIAVGDADERMPKDADPLSAKELTTIRNWIQQGAEFDGTSTQKPFAEQIPRARHPAAPERYPLPLPVTALAFLPDSGHVVVGGYHELTIWNADSGEVVQRVGNLARRTLAVAVSPDGSQLAVAGGTAGSWGELRLLDAKSFDTLAVLATSSDVIFDVSFCPDGKQLAAALSDQSIRIFDLASRELVRTIESHADWVVGIAWSSDGKHLVSASRDKTSKLFEMETGHLLTTYSGHAAPVHGVVFGAEDKQVISCGADKKIHVWNVADAKRIGEFPAHDGDVFKLAVVGEQLLSVSADGKARQCSTKDRKTVRDLDAGSDWAISLAVTRDRSRIAVGHFDGHVSVWNLAQGQRLTRFLASPQ